MTNIITFIPKDDVTSSSNMASFIAHSKRLSTFGADLLWASSAWEVTSHYDQRGLGNRYINLSFTDFAPKPGVTGAPMTAPFSDQVKAVIRYQASLSPNRYPPHRDIQAFRAIYRALAENGHPNLCDLDSHALDRSIQILLTRVSHNSTMQAGERLQSISQFLSKMKLSRLAPSDWKHGLRVSGSLFGRVGPEFEKRRQEKLPTQDLLDALAQAFNAASEPREQIETSVYALLCSAPDRINEVMSLPVDCEVTTDWETTRAYGLNWNGSKGFKDHIKWIPEPMVDTVTLAISRIRKHTQQARDVAKWYEENPTTIYLPPHLEHWRSHELLDRSEIGELLGISRKNNWAIRHGLVPAVGRRYGIGQNRAQYKFSDFERAIISKLPRSFPYFDRRSRLRFSEALMVVPYGSFHGHWQELPFMIQPLRPDQIAVALTGIETQSGRTRSLFERLSIPAPERTAKNTTHQFRHWLNTLALKGGLSDWDMAQWSGRKSIRQNRPYDHESSEEIQAKIRIDIDNSDKSTALSRAELNNQPTTRSDFKKISLPNAHITEIGYCLHDFASSPCQLFMDCINCRELVCVKGDTFRTNRIGQMAADAQLTLDAANHALANNWEGADEWVRAQTISLARFKELYSILTSADVTEGALVRIHGAGRYSAIEQSLRDHIGTHTVPDLDSQPVGGISNDEQEI